MTIYTEIDGECKIVCHETCKKCDGIEENNCTECDGEKHRMLVDNKCSCIEDYYLNSKNECK